MCSENKLDVFLNLRDQVAPSFGGLLQKLAFEALDDAFKVRKALIS